MLKPSKEETAEPRNVDTTKEQATRKRGGNTHLGKYPANHPIYRSRASIMLVKLPKLSQDKNQEAK
jgi:hypothetical protein